MLAIGVAAPRARSRRRCVGSPPGLPAGNGRRGHWRRAVGGGVERKVRLIAFRTLNAFEGAATGAASMALIFRGVPSGRPGERPWVGGPLVGAADRCSASPSWHRHPERGLAVDLRGPGAITLRGMVLSPLSLPETQRSREVRFDTAGALLLAGAVTSMPRRWLHPQTR